MDTILKVPKIPTICSSEIEQAKSEKCPINSGFFVAGQLYGVPVDFLFDTGSVATLISTNVYLVLPESECPRLEPSKIKLAGVNGANIGILGMAMAFNYVAMTLMMKTFYHSEENQELTLYPLMLVASIINCG